MILCAGYGTRLGGLTSNTPKPMLSIQGYPLLTYIVSHLAHQGFNQIAINLHFMPETIRDFFSDGSYWNVKIIYSYEQELLGTGGGIKKMEWFLRQSNDFLVHYGDILTDQDLSSMLRFHHQRKALATLLLHQRIRSNSVVSLDEEGSIIGFLERPSEEERKGVDSPWVNSGIYICAPELFEAIPKNTACDLPRDIFPKLMKTGRLYGFPLSGYRCAIDSVGRIAEARSAVAEGRCRIMLVRNDDRSNNHHLKH